MGRWTEGGRVQLRAPCLPLPLLMMISEKFQSTLSWWLPDDNGGSPVGLITISEHQKRIRISVIIFIFSAINEKRQSLHDHLTLYFIRSFQKRGSFSRIFSISKLSKCQRGGENSWCYPFIVEILNSIITCVNFDVWQA